MKEGNLNVYGYGVKKFYILTYIFWGVKKRSAGENLGRHTALSFQAQKLAFQPPHLLNLEFFDAKIFSDQKEV